LPKRTSKNAHLEEGKGLLKEKVGIMLKQAEANKGREEYCWRRSTVIESYA